MFVFPRDGSLLATAGNDVMVGLWTVATGQRWVSLDGQATWLPTVMFSPDGRTLVQASGDDDDIRLWDLADLLRAMPERNSSVLKNDQTWRPVTCGSNPVALLPIVP